MFKLFNPKTPEEKRKKRIENKCRKLLNELEDTYGDLTVEEQVEALIRCNKIFKQGKEKEVELLVKKQLEIVKAIKVLNKLV